MFKESGKVEERREKGGELEGFRKKGEGRREKE